MNTPFFFVHFPAGRGSCHFIDISLFLSERYSIQLHNQTFNGGLKNMVIKQETVQVIANFQYKQNLNSGSSSLHKIHYGKLNFEK